MRSHRRWRDDGQRHRRGIHCAAAATIWAHLHCNTEPSPLMRGLVARGDFGMKSAGRKGFYDWVETRIAHEQQRYQVALSKVPQFLSEKEDASVAAGAVACAPAAD